MPKRRPSQSKRRRSRRPPPPVATAQQQPVRPLPAVTPAAPAPAAEPSVTRFSTRDYSYVRREIARIAVLATAILITIVVLSFFLP